MDIEKEFRVLTKKEVMKSRIFKIYGKDARETSFSRLLLSHNCFYNSWWTSSCGNKNIIVVKKDGNLDEHFGFDYPIGCRPVIRYSFIKDFVKIVETKRFGVLEVEYGEYPKNIVSQTKQEFLEDNYSKNLLRKTGKSYTIPNKYINVYENVDYFLCDEYEYQGNKYVRFEADRNINESLNNEIRIEEGKPYWIKVEPVRFLVDKKYDIAITKDIVFSGVKYIDEFYYFGDFKTTNLYKYLNEVFAKDIVPSNIYTNSVNINEDTDIYIKLSGNKYQLIEILKKLNDELINVELLDEKDIIRKR